jgi:SAM-dependent methyltransferase
MIELARAALEDRAMFVVANLEDPLSFAHDATYDLVVASLVMHYVKDWDTVLGEFRRVLRDGGSVVFSTHHPAMDWQQTPDGYFTMSQITELWPLGARQFEVTFWRRPLRAMTEAITTAGFTIERLVEPSPLVELRELNPAAYKDLTSKPTFLFFRLRVNP